ncbi:hypothetical protein [Spongiactinospora sp. 9N601]|uniref:hypothetical protein n=1 Tax=Spongiactinospora sp. 9N601 TaxID=3375149 RepID=UPI0037941726
MPAGHIRRIDIAGVSYTRREAPDDLPYVRAVDTLRASDTPRGRRIVAALVVLEGVLGSGALNELLDRIDDEADPLDWPELLTAARDLTGPEDK